MNGSCGLSLKPTSARVPTTGAKRSSCVSELKTTWSQRSASVSTSSGRKPGVVMWTVPRSPRTCRASRASNTELAEKPATWGAITSIAPTKLNGLRV